MSNQGIQSYDETDGSKLSRKIKESPFMVAGLTGLVASCVIGAYKYKTRGSMSTSVYLMQLRVTAQGIVIGSLTAGMVLQMLNDFVFTKKTE